MNDTTTVPKSLNEMVAAFENKMIDVLAKFEAHYKKPMPIPQIIVKHSIGRKFGTANRIHKTITLNKDLCNEKYWTEMLDDTLPHEVSHLVAPLIYDSWRHGPDRGRGWGHGNAWRECMRVLGLEPNRCGQLDTETLKELTLRSVPRKYVYKCGCGKQFNLTAILHNRIQRDGRSRICRSCKSTIAYLGEKINAA